MVEAMRRGVTSGMLVVIIVGIVFILLWTFSGVGIPGLQKLEQSIFGTVDVVKPGDKPISPGGVFVREGVLKLGSSPQQEILNAAANCFREGVQTVKYQINSNTPGNVPTFEPGVAVNPVCAVVDASGLKSGFVPSKPVLSRLTEPTITSQSASFSLCTKKFVQFEFTPTYSAKEYDVMWLSRSSCDNFSWEQFHPSWIS